MRKRNPIYLLAALIMTAVQLTSCATQQRCQEKYGTMHDTVKVPVYITKDVPVEVTAKADSGMILIPIDSLKKLRTGDTLRKSSPDSHIGLKVFKTEKQPNQKASIGFKADYAANQIHDTIKVQVHDTIPCPTQIEFREPYKNRWQRAEQGFEDFSAIAVIVELLMVLGYFILKISKI